MKKKKVMHVLCMGGYSGAENVTITLINCLKSNFESVYVSPEGDIQEILKENKIEHYAVNSITVKSIKNAMKAIKPDIIHAHDFRAGVVCAIASSKVPVVNHLHNNATWIKKYCAKSLIYGAVAWRFERILTVSESVMDEYILGNYLKKKTFVIGNPIDLRSVQDKVNCAVLKEKSDIMFLGRLEEPKNPLLFIDIINEVTKIIPNVKVVMVGDGNLRDKVLRRIKELKLENHITLYGFQKNPYGLLDSTKILCMPSKWEGFGLAAVEGLFLGKTIVASPVGGLKKIINSECGFLCETINMYVKSIVTLLSNEELYMKKCEFAKKRAYDFDNIEDYKDKICEIYGSLGRLV